MNSQQLKLIRDLIIEKLSRTESLDAQTRSTAGSILAQVKEDLKVIERDEKRENRFREDWNSRVDRLSAEEQDHLEISFKQ